MKTLGFLLLVLGGMALGFAAERPKPELPKTGLNLARDGGGWINIEVKQNSFVVSFFDASKEPIAADVHHGLVRYSYVSKGSERAPLQRSADGKTLISPANVEEPHVFRVHLALFNDGPDELVETHAFSYRGK